MREKLKDVENLRRELNDKQSRVASLEADLSYLETLLQKKVQENALKSHDISFFHNQVCLFVTFFPRIHQNQNNSFLLFFPVKMKVFEEDFLSEREARESLANERDMLRDKLGCLQKQNKELLKELKKSPDDLLEK